MNRHLVSLLACAAVAIPLSASAQYRGDGYRGEQVRCSSNDERTQRCGVDTRGGVRIVRQESRSPCIQGRTWGHDRRGIWVSQGCRATFEVGGGYARGGYDDRGRGYYDHRGDNYYGGAQVVRCESRDERQRFCPVRGGLRDVQIVRRLSDTQCRYNYNWGFRRDGIWVDRGCRAEFRIN